MKTSTIMLASLTATGLLAAFILPLTLMLLSSGGEKPFNPDAPATTINTPPFRHLMIARTDRTWLYLQLDIIAEIDSTVHTPSVTLNEEVARWITLEEKGDTLCLNVSVPEAKDGGYNPGYCNTEMRMQIPAGLLQSMQPASLICSSVHMKGLDTSDFTFNSSTSLKLIDCRINTLSMPRGMNLALDSTHVGTIDSNLTHCPNAILSCCNAEAENLMINAGNAPSRQIYLSSANIGTINVTSGGPNGSVNLMGLDSTTIHKRL